MAKDMFVGSETMRKGLPVAGVIALIFAFLSMGSTARLADGRLATKLQEYLKNAPEVKWHELSTQIYSGPIKSALRFGVLHGESKVVYTARDAVSGRSTSLYFFDLLTDEKSEVTIIHDSESSSLDIQEFRVSPDSKTIWLCIGVYQVPGHHSWLRYDLEGGFDRTDEAYKELCERSKTELSPMRVQVSGPVWSTTDAKFYKSSREAEKAGVRRMKYHWGRTVPARRSKVLGRETLFEMVTGSYLKGHIFVKGEYVCSLSMAGVYVPQDCWFVKEAGGVTLYKFLRGGKDCYLKAQLGRRTIERVREVMDVGLLVRSYDDSFTYLDFVPLWLPEDLKETVDALLATRPEPQKKKK